MMKFQPPVPHLGNLRLTTPNTLIHISSYTLQLGQPQPPSLEAVLGWYHGILPWNLEGPRTGKSLESHGMSTFLMREQLYSNPHSKNQCTLQVMVVCHVVSQCFQITRTLKESCSLHTPLFNKERTRRLGIRVSISQDYL
ncbi:hypothetical protein HJG60_008742 [Phyllostomus discolor]|uniref:Uncharacterized protein n=1 Tax=Phyllostomus discolor TaxID=89673 RepID=A0A833YWB6_9CHIR|nr:hypothetical protein HJG60_008742 [Phyllostomus discolor]